MIRLDLTTLRLFLAVYNLGNISKAAEQEHIAPSAISKRVHSFELELGTQLFYRQTRGLTATPAGRALAEHAKRLFQNVNSITAELSNYVGGSRGEVRIHAHSSAVIQYLPAQLKSFLRTYAEVQVLLREETSENVLQSLIDGMADIGIVDSNLAIPACLKTMSYRTDRLVALIPVGHPLAKRRSIGFSEIRDSDHVSLETGSSLQILVARAAESMGFVLKTRIEVRTFEAAIRMVEAGLGIAVIPERVACDRKSGSKFRMVGLADPWAMRELGLCVKDAQPLTASAVLMLCHLRAPEVEVPPALERAMRGEPALSRPGSLAGGGTETLVSLHAMANG